MLALKTAFIFVYVNFLFLWVLKILHSYGIQVSHCFKLTDHWDGSLNHSLLSMFKAQLIVFAFGSIAAVLQQMLTKIGIISINVNLGGYLALTCTFALFFSVKPFRQIFARICVGGISSEFRLGDILLSDTLVSLASVLVDLGAVTVGLLHLSEPPTPGPKLMCLALIPSLIRIRQCLTDFNRTQNKQHLLNTCKYLIGLCPHLVRIFALYNNEVATMKPQLYFFLGLNNLTSFLWDVFVDWKLGIEGRVYELPLYTYALAMFVDFMFRQTFWYKPQTSWDVFGVQLIEITRRLMWVIFRIEGDPVDQLKL